MKYHSGRKYRVRAILQDVDVTNEYTQYLLGHVCNDKMPIGRAKALFERVWHDYFDEKQGKTPGLAGEASNESDDKSKS